MPLRWISLSLALAACSTSSASSPSPPGSMQALGAACDPSLQYPCVQGKDICRVSVCEPATRICTRYDNDAEATATDCGHGALGDGATE